MIKKYSLLEKLNQNTINYEWTEIEKKLIWLNYKPI